MIDFLILKYQRIMIWISRRMSRSFVQRIAWKLNNIHSTQWRGWFLFTNKMSSRWVSKNSERFFKTSWSCRWKWNIWEKKRNIFRGRWFRPRVMTQSCRGRNWRWPCKRRRRWLNLSWSQSKRENWIIFQKRMLICCLLEIFQIHN